MRINFYIRSSETCKNIFCIKLAASFKSSHHRKFSWSACAPHVAGIQKGRSKGQSTPCGDHSSPAIKLLRYWAVVAAPLCGQPFLGYIEKKPNASWILLKIWGDSVQEQVHEFSHPGLKTVFWSSCHLVLPTTTIYLTNNHGISTLNKNLTCLSFRDKPNKSVVSFKMLQLLQSQLVIPLSDPLVRRNNLVSLHCKAWQDVQVQSLMLAKSSWARSGGQM